MFQAILAGAGLALQAYSMFSSAGTQRQANALAVENAGYEKEIEKQKFNQMQLNARRQQLENIRNSQLARSMATNAATAQGAQFGSGLAGGIGQIGAQERWNSSGITQNLQIGENIFGLNSRISDNKMSIARLGGENAEQQAWGQLGGNLMKIGTSFGGNPFLSGGNNNSNSNSPIQPMQSYTQFLRMINAPNGIY